MITAVDTNVLADLFFSNQQFMAQSRAWIEEAQTRGGVVISYIVYAELAASLGNRASLEGQLQNISVTISPITMDIAHEAGLRWGQYRRAGGPRTRILTDFLIGAHAHIMAGFFLTRDQGFYSTYFPELSEG